MICCYTKHDMQFDDEGFKWIMKAPEDEDHLKAGEIWVTTHTFACHKSEVIKCIRMKPEFPLPPMLDRNFIENPPGKKKIRMIAHNGVGGGIGDCIGTLNAYRRLYDEFWRRGRHLEIDILCQDNKWMHTDHVMMFEPYVNMIIPGAVPLPSYCSYDVRTDTEGYTEDMDASGMHMYDYACKCMCVDTCGPHRPDWRIGIDPSTEVHEAVKDIPRPRALLNFFASSFRSIPKSHRRGLVEGLAAKGYNVILVGDRDNVEAARWAMKVSPKYRSRVHERMDITSRSLHHLAALCGLVDFVLTPDTGLMHMCGLAGVPTVGVFYSIEPSLRIRDFPNIVPFCPQVFRDGPHWGKHKPDLSGFDPRNNKPFYEKMAKLYMNPETVPGYGDTWRKISAKDILSLEGGPRIDSTIRTAPMRREDHDSSEPEPAATTSARPEGVSEEVHTPTEAAGDGCREVSEAKAQ